MCQGVRGYDTYQEKLKAGEGRLSRKNIFTHAV